MHLVCIEECIPTLYACCMPRVKPVRPPCCVSNSVLGIPAAGGQGQCRDPHGAAAGLSGARSLHTGSAQAPARRACRQGAFQCVSHGSPGPHAQTGRRHMPHSNEHARSSNRVQGACARTQRGGDCAHVGPQGGAWVSQAGAAQSPSHTHAAPQCVRSPLFTSCVPSMRTQGEHSQASQGMSSLQQQQGKMLPECMR